MAAAVASEDAATRAGQALTIIAQNIDQAESCDGPICQDTGMPTFEVHVPVGANQIRMRAQIREAVAEATRRGKLRPNSVDSITGENSGDNLGPGTPIIHFDQWEEDDVEIELILKGGGCENTNAQYALPAELSISAAPTGRSKASASASFTRSGRRREGLQSRRRGCLHRRRPYIRIPACEGAAVSNAR